MRAAMRNVASFHRATGAPVKSDPAIPSRDRVALRVELIREETEETLAALAVDDLVEIADGIADSIYVLVGTALEYGIPLDRVWWEVHRSNMEKTGGPRRADGKILKPPGWTPPNIRGAMGLE